MTCGYQPIGYIAPSRGVPNCSTTLRSIVQWMVEASGGTFQYGACYVKRNIFGSNRPSVHGTGRAYDVMIRNWRLGSPQNRLMEQMLSVYLMSQPCALGIQRMIFQSRIWDSSDPIVPWHQWRLMNEPLRSQQPHNNHLHIEIHPSKASKYTLQDIRTIFSNLQAPNTLAGGDSYPIPSPTDEPVQPRNPPPTTGGTSSGTGGGIGTSTTGTGSPGSGKDPITPVTAGTTAPVYSPTIPQLTACGVCGPPFSNLTIEGENPTAMTYTHCGGTGSICIEKATGRTCSQGTAPDIGHFPGPIKDFLWWGDGAYALAVDGYNIYVMGNAAWPQWDNVGDPLRVGPWDNIYSIGPSMIAVSAVGQGGFRAARGKVNSIATYTCCS